MITYIDTWRSRRTAFELVMLKVLAVSIVATILVLEFLVKYNCN